MQAAKFMGNEKLLRSLCDASARMDADDFDLIDSPRLRALGEWILRLRHELLLRMGGGRISPENEKPLQELVRVHVDAVNSGEEKSPEIRVKLEDLGKWVLAKASGKKAPQAV